MVFGPTQILNYFMKESRRQAAMITALGIVLVLSGRTRMGFFCELFGLLNLFGYVTSP